MIVRRLLQMGGLSLLALNAQAKIPNAPPTKVTICALVANPQEFTGKEVQVTANYESDGIERSIFIDSTCKKTLDFTWRDGIPGADQLERAVFAGGPGTIDKKITVTFIGRFVFKPRIENDGFIHHRGAKIFGILQLQSVADVHVESMPTE